MLKGHTQKPKTKEDEIIELETAIKKITKQIRNLPNFETKKLKELIVSRSKLERKYKLYTGRDFS